MDLSQLLQFLPENIEYISLQKEINHFERHALQDRSVKDLGDSLLDFNDTAAICDLLDLIISVDTSVVHLAAAMGKKTWLLLPFAPDWRWMLHRSDSPWYQSMTIYRQDVSRNYQTVLECIKKDLTDQFGGKTK
jgi:ADP-heptose:LPS heptosyltransferase